MLAGQKRPGDRALEAYDRDALAEPLRLLEDLLVSVRAGLFDPDATRSGRWRRAPREADVAPKLDRCIVCGGARALGGGPGPDCCGLCDGIALDFAEAVERKEEAWDEEKKEEEAGR